MGLVGRWPSRKGIRNASTRRNRLRINTVATFIVRGGVSFEYSRTARCAMEASHGIDVCNCEHPELVTGGCGHDGGARLAS